MCNLFFEYVSSKNFPPFPHPNYCSRDKAVSIKYYERASVFLPLLCGMQILRHITLSSVACLADP
jgi:hypothetical protein